METNTNTLHWVKHSQRTEEQTEGTNFSSVTARRFKKSLNGFLAQLSFFYKHEFYFSQKIQPIHFTHSFVKFPE